MSVKPKLVILSGAGMSAESGLSTFRDKNGLWENHSIHDVASPEGWEKDRELVLNFYNERRRKMWSCQPNAGHLGLAQLESIYDVEIVTQNIDNLHERAGSTRVLHLHGELSKARSTLDPELVCEIGDRDLLLGSRCARGSQLRPHIVWFGEDVPLFQRATEIVGAADIVVIIGTSLSVYPAASLVNFAPDHARIFLIDPQPNPTKRALTVIRSTATEGVAQLIRLLADPQPAVSVP